MIWNSVTSVSQQYATFLYLLLLVFFVFFLLVSSPYRSSKRLRFSLQGAHKYFHLVIDGLYACDSRESWFPLIPRSSTRVWNLQSLNGFTIKSVIRHAPSVIFTRCALRFFPNYFKLWQAVLHASSIRGDYFDIGPREGKGQRGGDKEGEEIRKYHMHEIDNKQRWMIKMYE